MKRIAIVGNGPVDPRLFAEIDAMEHVVRFNKPPPANQYPAMRTDQLSLVNSASIKGTLKSPAYLATPAWQTARAVLLPLHPDIIGQRMPPAPLWKRLLGQSRDKSAAIGRIAQAAGKPVETIAAEIFFTACRALNIPGKYYFPRGAPSSGMLVITHFLETTDAQLALFGFGFQGSKWHDWEAEKKWVEGQERVVIKK